MLWDAKRLAIQLSGQGSMWQNPFAHPDPRAALERASVWFTAYPLSFITRPGESFLSGARRPGALAGVPRRSGSTRVHTGPVKQAGGLDGWRLTPSVDGHFDRISMQVDPAFGTEEQFRTPVRDRGRVRRHGHRRHRPGPHRQGRGLPPGRDGLRRLPGHLPHGRDRARRTGTCCPTSPRAATPSNLDARGRGARSSAPATSSAACSA